MAHPPTTKKPIPVSIRRWRAELAGIERYLKKLQRMERDFGNDWVAKQRAYYAQRIDDLLDNAPPALVQRGEGRIARS